MILVPLLNPKFATVPTEKPCELRVRGTSCALLLFLDARAGRRADADDEKERVLVLGTVPVHRSAEMGHEAAGRDRHRVVGGIELRPAADPSSALKHRDASFGGLEVWPAEVVALEPLV